MPFGQIAGRRVESDPIAIYGADFDPEVRVVSMNGRMSGSRHVVLRIHVETGDDTGRVTQAPQSKRCGGDELIGGPTPSLMQEVVNWIFAGRRNGSVAVVYAVCSQVIQHGLDLRPAAWNMREAVSECDGAGVKMMWHVEAWIIDHAAADQFV